MLLLSVGELLISVLPVFVADTDTVQKLVATNIFFLIFVGFHIAGLAYLRETQHYH